MIHLDTSVLVEALTGARRLASRLEALLLDDERPSFSTLVLYEWLRGPRDPLELETERRLFDRARVVPFGAVEGETAARLYRVVRRARDREVDLAIAACAIAHNAPLWTLNRNDFADIPGLVLYEPPRR
jgi:predicted nucleic acid-binding protein